MLSHIHVGVSDFDRALAFYGPLMDVLGYPLKFADREAAMAGWKPQAADRPLFLIGRPYDGEPASCGNGQMIALLAPSRAAVEQCYQAALAQGGQSEGAPGLRPHYHPHYYGAYFRDPDGNKLCVCCHAPAGTSKDTADRQADFMIAPLTDTPAIRAGLRDLLMDVVDAGGLVHFMAPLSPADADVFWDGALKSASRGERLMFGAFDGTLLTGTVTILLNSPPNAPHRAEVAKMMTLSSHRRRGIARALLRHAEREGLKHGKTLLVLDTAAEGGSSALYESEGFSFMGGMPDHAYRPHGGFCATRFYYKQVRIGQ